MERLNRHSCTTAAREATLSGDSLQGMRAVT
jgi:hypothetical protein